MFKDRFFLKNSPLWIVFLFFPSKKVELLVRNSLNGICIFSFTKEFKHLSFPKFTSWIEDVSYNSEIPLMMYEQYNFSNLMQDAFWASTDLKTRWDDTEKHCLSLTPLLFFFFFKFIYYKLCNDTPPYWNMLPLSRWGRSIYIQMFIG